MKTIKNIEWFKNEVAIHLGEYELIYKTFGEGDFGSLNQVEFNSDMIGGNIDFWELGWLGVFIWDYLKEEELLNVLLEPQQGDEKEVVLQEVQKLLYKSS